MKINGAGGINGLNPISAKYNVNKLAAYNKTQTASGGDKVAFSQEALTFSKIYTQAKELALTRDTDSRIAQIKEQIAAGTYRVNSEDIAGSILGDLLI